MNVLVKKAFYLKRDVLLIAGVFGNFNNTCLELYGLDPSHYCGSPRVSWDGMLKLIEIELELIADIDMYSFVEKWMRGGISYIAKRFSKANNKCTQSYDDSRPSKYIIYFDAVIYMVGRSVNVFLRVN